MLAEVGDKIVTFTSQKLKRSLQSGWGSIILQVVPNHIALRPAHASERCGRSHRTLVRHVDPCSHDPLRSPSSVKLHQITDTLTPIPPTGANSCVPVVCLETAHYNSQNQRQQPEKGAGEKKKNHSQNHLPQAAKA